MYTQVGETKQTNSDPLTANDQFDQEPHHQEHLWRCDGGGMGYNVERDRWDAD